MTGRAAGGARSGGLTGTVRAGGDFAGLYSKSSRCAIMYLQKEVCMSQVTHIANFIMSLLFFLMDPCKIFICERVQELEPRLPAPVDPSPGVSHQDGFFAWLHEFLTVCWLVNRRDRQFPSHGYREIIFMGLVLFFIPV